MFTCKFCNTDRDNEDDLNLCCDGQEIYNLKQALESTLQLIEYIQPNHIKAQYYPLVGNAVKKGHRKARKYRKLL
jgi:hypothetical protein